MTPIYLEAPAKVFDDPPFILCHEKEEDRLLKTLEKWPKIENPLHLGVSGLHNYSIMWQRKSELGLIVDINLRTKTIHEVAQKCFLLCKTPHAFVDEWIKEIEQLEDGHSYFDITTKERVRNELRAESSFLGSQEAYDYVSHLFKEKKIIVQIADITAPKTVQVIQEWLKQNQLQFDSIYLSNVGDSYWLNRCRQVNLNEPDETFPQKIAPLLHSNSLIIASSMDDSLRLNVYSQDDYIKQSDAISKVDTPWKKYICVIAAVIGGIILLITGIAFIYYLYKAAQKLKPSASSLL